MLVVQEANLSPCKRLRTLRLKLTELTSCPPYVARMIASLEFNPSLETVALIFYSLGVSRIDDIHTYGDEWDPMDTQLCRLAELKGPRLHVSVEFYGFEMRQEMINFGAFLANFRRSHSLTVLCNSKIVPHVPHI